MKEFLASQEGQDAGQSSGSQANNMLLLPLGIIEVVHVVPRGVSTSPRKGVLNVVISPEVGDENRPEKRLRKTLTSIMFSEEDLEGTS